MQKWEYSVRYAPVDVADTLVRMLDTQGENGRELLATVPSGTVDDKGKPVYTFVFKRPKA